MAQSECTPTRLFRPKYTVCKYPTGLINESCAASVLDGTEIVYVVTVPVYRIMTIHLPIGSRFPAYGTSQGRILLGSLSKTALDRALKESNIKKHTKCNVTSIPQMKRIIRRDYSSHRGAIRADHCGDECRRQFIVHDPEENDFNGFAPAPASCEGYSFPLTRLAVSARR
jgi:hypothetical protein